MSSFTSNDNHDAILQYSSMPEGHAHVEQCTTELHFKLRRINLNHHYIRAFIALGTPYAFYIAPEEQHLDKPHYRISNLAKHRTLDRLFNTYIDCVEAIMAFCQAQEVAL